MSIFTSSSTRSPDAPLVPAYAVAQMAEARTMGMVRALHEGDLRVVGVHKLDDGTYQVLIDSPEAQSSSYFLDAEGLHQLAEGRMSLEDLVSVDRHMAEDLGAGRALPDASRHRLAQTLAVRRMLGGGVRPLYGAHAHPHAPRAQAGDAYRAGYEAAIHQRPLLHAPPALAALPAFRAGFADGTQALGRQGSSVTYGAGALDSAWADLTRSTIDAAGADLSCPSSLPQTTDYARCTCPQIQAKKAYWQAKEFAEPLGSARRKVYGTRVNALAMFEATCDQQKGNGCKKGEKQTTDYSKLSCGCLEAKRRYWVDKASKEPVLSGSREMAEARANHIATFKATCTANATGSSSTSSSASSGSSTTYSTSSSVSPNSVSPNSTVAPSGSTLSTLSAASGSVSPSAASIGLASLSADHALPAYSASSNWAWLVWWRVSMRSPRRATPPPRCRRAPTTGCSPRGSAVRCPGSTPG